MAIERKSDGMFVRVRADDQESREALLKAIACSLEDKFQAAREDAIQRKDGVDQDRAETVLRYLEHADREGRKAIQATIWLVSSHCGEVMERWNPHAKSGQRSDEGGEKGRENRPSNRDLWQKEADQLGPGLSKTAKGKIIAEIHGGAPGYIRKVIK